MAKRRVGRIVILGLLSALLTIGAVGCNSIECNREIEVQVLDYVSENLQGYSYPDFQITTTYEYDEKGRVVSSAQTSSEEDPSLNLCRSSFEYDDKNQLIKVSNAYEQYDWRIGNAQNFAYDEQGRCTSYRYEIVSEGEGAIERSYEYEENSELISSATESFYGYEEDPYATSSLTWFYTNEGRIEKILSDSPSTGNFGLDSTLSDTDSGIYSYQDSYGYIITLRYDEYGNLSSLESGLGNLETRRDFFYKTIKVKASEFTPSIYSNPTGFSEADKPQLTAQEILAIKS